MAKLTGTYQRRKRAVAVQRFWLRLLLIAIVFGVSGWLSLTAFASNRFRFEIIGDRTGEPKAGVYEQAWKEAASMHPNFVVSVGDTIQGESDNTMNQQWQAVMQLLRPFAKIPTHFTVGNHDVWDSASAAAYEHYTHDRLYYSFDYEQAHFTILDENKVDPLAPISPDQLKFLSDDLKAHQSQPLKFVFSHTPFWLLGVMTRDMAAQMEVLAKKYNVRYVIAGHLHQMLHFDENGVTYLSVASSGGHLRGTKQYKDGWFFAHITVDVDGTSVQITIHELPPPYGKGRVTHPDDWGKFGLVSSQRSRSSSWIFVSVPASRYFTITGVYSEIPHSAPFPEATRRAPATTTASAGITSGAASVARWTISFTRS